MPKPSPSDYLIDTGAIELFVTPPDESILKFWRSLGDVQHMICEVVYWEFMRQFDVKKNSLARQNFMKALKRGILESVPIDRDAANIAVSIYQHMRSGLAGGKSDRRIRMNELQCDIMIAAAAVRHGRTVVTDDPKDWAQLREIVVSKKLGTLPILVKDDMRDPSRWSK